MVEMLAARALNGTPAETRALNGTPTMACASATASAVETMVARAGRAAAVVTAEDATHSSETRLLQVTKRVAAIPCDSAFSMFSHSPCVNNGIQQSTLQMAA